MQAQSVNRFVGTSPRKMRLVIDLIRGRGVEDALNILHYSPKHASKTAEKVLRSAISNFQNKDEAGRTDTATLYVKEAFVDGGPSVKRVMPAPMGRAFRIRKRSNHITIIVAQRAQAPALAPQPAKEKKTAAKAPTPKRAAAKKPRPTKSTTKSKAKAKTTTTES